MIGNDWDHYLKDTIEQNKDLLIKVDKLYEEKTIYPKKDEIFNALKLTPLNKVKMVIIGQDPYHGENEAHGLSFSVRNGIKSPPSLKNIFKELEKDLGIKNTNTDLTAWAKEGILLLNTILTVEKDKPLSHKKLGWQEITDEIIKIINKEKINVIFMLWGNEAIKKEELIDSNKHLIIKTSHPSPFSYNKGFKDGKIFKTASEYMKNNNIDIDYKL